LGIKSQVLDALRALCVAPPSKDQVHSSRTTHVFFLEHFTVAHQCNFMTTIFSAIFEKAYHSRLFVPQQEHNGVPRRESEMIFLYVKFD
jgi:hypothetical protein